MMRMGTILNLAFSLPLNIGFPPLTQLARADILGHTFIERREQVLRRDGESIPFEREKNERELQLLRTRLLCETAAL